MCSSSWGSRQTFGIQPARDTRPSRERPQRSPRHRARRERSTGRQRSRAAQALASDRHLAGRGMSGPRHRSAPVSSRSRAARALLARPVVQLGCLAVRSCLQFGGCGSEILFPQRSASRASCGRRLGLPSSASAQAGSTSARESRRGKCLHLRPRLLKVFEWSTPRPQMLSLRQARSAATRSRRLPRFSLRRGPAASRRPGIGKASERRPEFLSSTSATKALCASFREPWEPSSLRSTSRSASRLMPTANPIGRRRIAGSSLSGIPATDCPYQLEAGRQGISCLVMAIAIGEGQRQNFVALDEEEERAQRANSIRRRGECRSRSRERVECAIARVIRSGIHAPGS